MVTVVAKGVVPNALRLNIRGQINQCEKTRPNEQFDIDSSANLKLHPVSYDTLFWDECMVNLALGIPEIFIVSCMQIQSSRRQQLLLSAGALGSLVLHPQQLGAAPLPPVTTSEAAWDYSCAAGPSTWGGACQNLGGGSPIAIAMPPSQPLHSPFGNLSTSWPRFINALVSNPGRGTMQVGGWASRDIAPGYLAQSMCVHRSSLTECPELVVRSLSKIA